ncbi:MAG TPA: hypothetical protein VJ276_14120 [Thermoanaerobaculia bacterium]|nr:hypothetical protein [Thermoanaerobaculia bacterium]
MGPLRAARVRPRQAPIEAVGTLRFEGPITGPGTLRLNGFAATAGSLNTSRQIDLGNGGTLTLLDGGSFGDPVVGSGPVFGTFDRLPEGAIVAGNVGGLFQISYKGGDGNDVEVTALPPLAPVPMLDWWMLIALAAVIAVIGIQARLMR